MKKEDKVRDLFIKYLKKTERTTYTTIGEDVPSKNGNKNFDYLLHNEDGKTLALEITQATKSSFGPTNSRFDMVASFLRDLLNDGNGLPAMTIHVPNFNYTENKLNGILNRESNRIDEEIRQKLPGIRIGERFHVEIPGYYVIGIEREQGRDFLNVRPVMTHIWSSHQGEVDVVSPQVAKLLCKKNRQLDYDANRRVLLILDTRFRFMRNDSVIHSAVTRFPDENSDKDIESIDEIFICHAKNSFTTAYDRSR